MFFFPSAVNDLVLIPMIINFHFACSYVMVRSKLFFSVPSNMKQSFRWYRIKGEQFKLDFLADLFLHKYYFYFQFDSFQASEFLFLHWSEKNSSEFPQHVDLSDFKVRVWPKGRATLDSNIFRQSPAGTILPAHKLMACESRKWNAKKDFG